MPPRSAVTGTSNRATIVAVTQGEDRRTSVRSKQRAHQKDAPASNSWASGKHPNGRTLYDVCFQRAGDEESATRLFYVSRVDGESHWELPGGGIPLYPSCTARVTVVKAKDLVCKAGTECFVDLHNQYIAYLGGKPEDNLKQLSEVLETPKEAGPDPKFKFSGNFSPIWDEGLLVFKAKIPGGWISSEQVIGRGALKKSDFLPGGKYKVKVPLQQNDEKPAGSLEVRLDIDWPEDQCHASPPLPSQKRTVATAAGGYHVEEDHADHVDWRTQQVVDIFSKYDDNEDGTIDKGEFRNLLASFCKSLDAAKLDRLFVAADTNGDGRLDYGEVVEFLLHGSANRKAGDPPAESYVPAEGDVVLVPDWCPEARLLLRDDGTFSYVLDASHKYAQGVQGMYSIKRAVGSAVLRASLFGSMSRSAPNATEEVLLGDESDVPRCCSLPESSRLVEDTWLRPGTPRPLDGPEEVWEPGQPVVFQLDAEGFRVDKLVELFEETDADGSGQIDVEEFVALVAKLMPGRGEAYARSLMSFADKDGGGDISFAEFIDLVLDPDDAASDGVAANYQPMDGEQIYVGKFNPAGRLLVRPNGTFSYVASSMHSFSDGVQGKCGLLREYYNFEATHFGKHAAEAEPLLQTISLTEEPYSKGKSYRGLLKAVHTNSSSKAWGWLRPAAENGGVSTM